EYGSVQQFRRPIVQSGAAAPQSLAPEELVQCSVQSFQTAAQHRRFSGYPDPKVLRHAKEMPGHDRCFVFSAQQFKKRFRIAAAQFRKHHTSGWRMKTFKLRVRVKKLIEQAAVSR